MKEISSTPSHDISAEFAEFLHHVRQAVLPEDIRTAADIGSRDGLVALQMKRHFPNASIYAFECNPEAVSLVQNNIANTSAVTLVPKAVSNVDGVVTFFPINKEKTVTPHSDGNIGASSLLKANPEYPYETYVQDEIQVPSTRLETWARQEGVSALDVIWMDLQGAESLALQGMGELLRQTKVLYTEVSYQRVYQGQPLAHEISALLESNGFVRRARIGDNDWFGNQLFIRKDLLPWWRKIVRVK